MLRSLDSDKLITDIPHKKEYDIWRKRLTDEEYNKLISILTEKFNEKEIQTSSWIPGSDWSNTPYQIIYKKACLCNEQFSAFFFGLIVWHTAILHPDTWIFMKNVHEDIKGMTYFKQENL